MNQKEMLLHCERMLLSIQRLRSISREEIERLTDAEIEIIDSVLEWTDPWVHSDKAPLKSLSKVIDRGHVTGMEFYNFMVIVDRFAPIIGLYCQAVLEHSLPKPDVHWCTIR